MSARVVLVGHRGGALDAAARAGITAHLVHDRRPPRPVASVDVLPFDDEEAAWHALARRLLREGRPEAVVALRERAVVPAARLRAALGLSGASIEVARRTTDKLLMKQTVAAAGIPCAAFADTASAATPREAARRLGLPLVLKPRRGQGGRDHVTWWCEEELPERWPYAGLAESFVRGSEMSVELLLSRGRIAFFNATDYIEPGWANVVPAALDPGSRQALESFARRAIEALGVTEGIVHLEVFLTRAGLVFGELATRPPGGHLMELIRLTYGFDPWEASLRLALAESPALPAAATCVSAVRLLHPGPGRVRAVHGVEAARATPDVRRVRVRVAAGDEVPERLGVGQEVGHILTVAPDRATAVAALARASSLVVVALDRA